MQGRSFEAVRILSAAEPAFAELISIYEEALPASERKSIPALAAMLGRPHYRFLVALENNSVIGFAILLRFRPTDACLLEYLAVAREHRGRGVGRFLFRRIAGSEDIAGSFLLVEVDAETSSTDTESAGRRAFYRKLGCREIAGFNYIMPPVANAIPPAMHLLAYRDVPSETIARAELRRWLESCYAEVYGHATDDARIDRMLAGIPDSVRLI